MEELFGWFIGTSDDAKIVTDGEQISVLHGGKVIGSVEMYPQGYYINATNCTVIVNPENNTIKILPGNP
ncbi:MAG: hypothetical protein AAGU23_07380 [Bacillota bacterium]|nr:hypothetical protein [Bacillota bacterium]